jgi:hypothetical protein
MNTQATITVFDEITLRKDHVSSLIERNEEALTVSQLEMLQREYDWITCFQLKVMQALYTQHVCKSDG